MNELIKTAPEKIYLCVSDDESSRDEPFPDYQGEVTWADHQAVPVNVEYVRSDKVIDDEIRHRLILVCEYLETVGLMFVSPRVISSQIRAILEAGNEN